MLLGQPPAPEFIPNEPCHDGSGPIEQDRLVVNGDGSLRNVLVWLEGLPRTTGAHRPPALLDQKNCQYVPHVLGVQIQQKLVIRSSDPTLHNVHYAPEQNQSANFGFVGEGVERQTSFERAEIIHTRCNVHPWMHAYVGVFDNAFFAVTGDGGTYHIAGVPAGTYTLVAWHEQLGRREQTIVVPQDASPPAVEASFEFRI
jgi:hypothetical protein